MPTLKGRDFYILIDHKSLANVFQFEHIEITQTDSSPRVYKSIFNRYSISKRGRRRREKENTKSETLSSVNENRKIFNFEYFKSKNERKKGEEIELLSNRLE
ncbi:Motile sperm domain-containing protein 2 [Sarcoptes scabiei]|nr:Motile sperm domain-containing protein 2 [Sarcoptes scabiei]